MSLEIITKNDTSNITVTDLNRVQHSYDSLVLKNDWYKVTIPGTRFNVVDIKVHGESIKHCLNAGSMTDNGYNIWIHGDLAHLFARISECVAQDDLLKFKRLEQKYLLCESWNENFDDDFIPNSVKNFFRSGEGPFWYSKDNWMGLPYLEYEGPPVSKDIDFTQDLIYADEKFYGKGKCRSLKASPAMPSLDVDDIKSDSLRHTMKSFGFTEMVQIQLVTMEPNSALPVHRDDWTYQDCRHLLQGPVQLYFVLSGDKDSVKFKFKNVGLLNVDRPIFVNNQQFVHSLIYTGKTKRTVLLAYGKRT